MTASLVEYLKSGPPAPRVALLSDQRFFIRAIPVAPDSDERGVATQAELALEGMTPFPPAQMFFGHYWVPGSPHALVFASYRKRFPADQVAEWGQARLVAPMFTAFLEADHKPGATLIYPTAEGITAIHWDQAAVPTKVLTRALAPEATPEDRDKARQELLREAGESLEVIDVSGPPEAVASAQESILNFRAGEAEVDLSAATADMLDVRDPADLAAHRREARTSLILWRVAAGSMAALLLLALSQAGVSFGGKQVLASQKKTLDSRRPAVEVIEEKETLAKQIEDLSTDRLLPLEWMTAITSLRQIGQITLTQASVSSRAPNTLSARGSTPVAQDVDAYERALRSLENVNQVSFSAPRSGQLTTFDLMVEFKAGAFNASTKMAAKSAPAP